MNRFLMRATLPASIHNVTQCSYALFRFHPLYSVSKDTMISNTIILSSIITSSHICTEYYRVNNNIRRIKSDIASLSSRSPKGEKRKHTSRVKDLSVAN